MDIIEVNGVVVTNNTTRFSAGEVQLRVGDVDLFSGVNVVKAHITTSDGVMLLLQLSSLIQGQDNTLILPYLPYSRYDHTEDNRDPLSLKVFASIINSMRFNKVVTHDCHSDVGVALIDNCVNIPQHELIQDMLKNSLSFYDAIVSPDAGASKKAFKLSQAIGLPLIECGKHRDFKTGAIINFTVPSQQLLSENIKSVLIVDDIADGGGTFSGLAKELLSYVDIVDLYVTHGIFSKGKEYLKENIKNIFNYHDWSNINLKNF